MRPGEPLAVPDGSRATDAKYVRREAIYLNVMSAERLFRKKGSDPFFWGIDLHANNSLIPLLDEQDLTCCEKRLPGELVQICAVLQPCRGEPAGCSESPP